MGRFLAAWIACTLAMGFAWADAELVFHDGQVLRGVEVELVENEFFLRMESGGFVIVPRALVVELRLIEEEEPWPPTGLVPGVMLVSAPGAEARLLDAAATLEAGIGRKPRAHADAGSLMHAG